MAAIPNADPTMLNLFMQPMVQYGFLGLCAILLGVIIWLVRGAEKRNDRYVEQAGEQIHRTVRVIEQNTSAVKQLTTTTHELVVLCNQMHDRMMHWPHDQPNDRRRGTPRTFGRRDRSPATETSGG